MAIQYATGTRINATFAGNTKALIRDGIETNLLAAGWTTVSGSGTADLLMQSGLTPQSLQIRARFRDIGGNCLVASLQDVAGTLVGTVDSSNGCYLFPATSKVFRIVANKYQFFVFTAPVTQAREFIACGVPYIPSHLTAMITVAGWMHSNSQSDTDTGVDESWRTRTHVNGFQYLMLNSSRWQGSAPFQGKLLLQAIYSGTGGSGNGACFRWHDDSAFIMDALVAWGLTAGNVEGKVRGQLCDAMISTESYTGDLTTSYDSHNWIVITHSNTQEEGRGTLFICIP